MSAKWLLPAILALALGLSLSVVLSGEFAVRRYAPIAERMAHEFDVDPNLVLAVIGAESAGRPRARSRRGAIGLMQVMPATAAQLARELDMPPLTEKDLEDPETNVRLGTYYLSKLDKRFEGDRMLALAGYNAGPARVGEWQREHPQLSGHALIEKAAYAETRGFVRAVTRRMRE